MKKIILCIALSLFIYACAKDESPSGTNNPVTPAEDSTTPTDPQPVDGAMSVSNVVKFSWVSQNADSFKLLLDTNNPPVATGRSKIIGNSTTLYVPGISRTYFWQLIAYKNDGTILTGKVWKFTTKGTTTVEPGFQIIPYSFRTQLPNKVKILFQVLDMEGKGVPNLVRQDFELFDDDEEVSDYESRVVITKRDKNPFTLQTLLMLDNSSSISDSDPNNLTLIKDAANNFVTTMIDQQEIAVYKFSANPEMVIDYTGKISQLTISAAINSINAGARTTNLYGAVISGASKLQDIIDPDNLVQSYMIIITDGNDTQGSETLTNALKAVEDKKVYTIGLGVEIDPEILDLIGTSGFFPIDQPSQIAQVHQNIQDDIIALANSFYWLEYESPRRGSAIHKLHLQIKGNFINSFIEENYNSTGFFDPQAGIYFNSTIAKPEGITEIGIVPGTEGVIVKVTTYGGNNSVQSVYNWQVDSRLTYNYLDGNNSEVNVRTPAGTTPGTKISITVDDTVNGFSNVINFVILAP